ncbi:MAG: hypothetical protein ACRDPD_27215 [Streptosporangiaceae bacterium]
MNEKICGTRGLRCVGALAVVAAAALLTAACSAPSSPSVGGGGTSTAESAAYRANIAFAQCMRTHGVPSFPDPGPSTDFHVSGGPVHGAPTSTLGKAYSDCSHLLPNGSSSNNGQVTTQELSEGVTLAQCLRSHGEPSFPDPTVVNGSLTFAFTAVNTSQFQTAVNDCRSVTPAGIKLP